MTDERAYLPAGQVRTRYGVSDMALWRWLKNEPLKFPQPMRINGRRFWRLADLQEWELGKQGGTDASST